MVSKQIPCFGSNCSQDRWDLAIHNAPDQCRICALVVVDQNVAEFVHFSPDLPGCLPDNLEVPAHGVQENVRGHATLVSQDGALAEPLAAVQNVKKVNPRIWDWHRLYRLGFSQNAIPQVTQAVRRHDIHFDFKQVPQIQAEIDQIEQSSVLVEFHQQINIARFPVVAAGYRTEHTDARGPVFPPQLDLTMAVLFPC